MKMAKKYCLFILGFFILICSAPVGAQFRQDMTSTSPALHQEVSSYNKRNADALMYSGSKYAGCSEVSNGGATGGSGTTHPGRPRRVNQDNKPSGPFDDPLGDAAWPLALLALAYIGVRVVRKQRRGLYRHRNEVITSHANNFSIK